MTIYGFPYKGAIGSSVKVPNAICYSSYNTRTYNSAVFFGREFLSKISLFGSRAFGPKAGFFIFRPLKEDPEVLVVNFAIFKV